MIFLLGSVITSCLLVILFRLFQKKNIELIQAITVNYAVCVVCGILYNKNVFRQMLHLDFGVYALAVLQGFLFIFMFFQIGKASQEIGLSYTGLFGRISVVVPVSVSIFLFQEKITVLQGIGLIVALMAIYFLNSSNSQKKLESNNILKRGIILFVGNGIIDTVFKVFTFYYSFSVPQDIFTIMVFGTAGILGFSYLIINKNVPQLKNIISGILLGVPNFFSLIFMLSALNKMDGSKFFPLNNIGIIFLLTFVGVLFFNEKVYPKMWLGLFMTVMAILLISELITI